MRQSFFAYFYILDKDDEIFNINYSMITSENFYANFWDTCIPLPEQCCGLPTRILQELFLDMDIF